MPSNLSLRDLLAAARKRELFQLLMDRGSQTLIAAMAGAILLLLLGTQVLEWYWVAGLIVVSIGIGLWRVTDKIPSAYTLAQRIDRRLSLADNLSTALFFSENPDPERGAVCRLQHSTAETTAREVDVKAAIPYHRSRFLLPAAGLALVAMGLFAVRYMVTGTMSLQPSLVAAAFDTFFPSKTEQAKNLKPEQKNVEGKDTPDNPSVENQQQPEDLLKGNDATEEPVDSPDNSKSAAESGEQDKQDDAKQGDEQADGKDQAGKDQQGSESKKGNEKQGTQNSSKEQKGGNQSESMMDKLKDAMQNLMNSMKSNGDNKQQSAQNQKDKQSQKSEQGKGEQSQSDPQSQASADQQGQEGSQQQSDSKSAQKSADKASQQDAKNGAGSQDGDKLRRQAQELEAMGKISQIIGQRSANITGEVTIEVGSSKQQLKTPWSTSQAAHHDAGGEIHRDEVPLMYQEFVRQYFEEIHKPVAPAGKPSPPRAATPQPSKTNLVR